MMMPLWKKALLSRYCAPAGDDGSDTGGTDAIDRGDVLADPDLDPDNPDGDLVDPFEDKGDKVDDKGDKAEDKADEKGDDKDAKGEDKGTRKDSRIPLSRHKEILDRERSQREVLEQRLAQFEKGNKIAQTNEDLTKMEDGVIAMEKQYNKLLSDGEVDKASDLMTKIRQAERQITETKSDMRMQVVEARARESARYDIALERIEESFPVLNPDHDDFDKEKATDVSDLRQVYLNRGMTPTKALQEAVKKLLGAGTTKQQETALTANPRVTEADLAAERKKNAANKTADAARRTPPNTRDVGMDSDKAGGGLTPKAVMDMSQDEFSKLTEEQLARVRGDVV